MSEPRDTCREVALPSGETIRVRGSEDPSPEAVAALGELVDATRRLHAEQNPPDVGSAELHARILAARERAGLLGVDAARQMGVKLSVLVRLAQGHMPDGEDLAAIEAWLKRQDGHVGDPAPSSHLITRDPFTGMRVAWSRWALDGEIPSPNGCRWCGHEQQSHAQLWKPSVGWHTWVAPTDAQRLARMGARRSRRLMRDVIPPGTRVVVWAPGVSANHGRRGVMVDDNGAACDVLLDGEARPWVFGRSAVRVAYGALRSQEATDG